MTIILKDYAQLPVSPTELDVVIAVRLDPSKVFKDLDRVLGLTDRGQNGTEKRHGQCAFDF